MAEQAQIERDEKGRIKKGSKLNPTGRTSPNRVTLDMKQMIETALHYAGLKAQAADPAKRDLAAGAAYLAKQAEENPVAFLGLVKGLLPKQLDVEVTMMTRDLTTVLSQRRDQLAQMRDITPEEDD